MNPFLRYLQALRPRQRIRLGTFYVITFALVTLTLGSLWAILTYIAVVALMAVVVAGEESEDDFTTWDAEFEKRRKTSP